MACPTDMAWQRLAPTCLPNSNHWTPFVSIQNHYHMFERAATRGAPVLRRPPGRHLRYFPLAGGFLTGKYRRGARPLLAARRVEPLRPGRLTDANYDKLEKLVARAAAREHTIGELAHTWLLAPP